MERSKFHTRIFSFYPKIFYDCNYHFRKAFVFNISGPLLCLYLQILIFVIKSLSQTHKYYKCLDINNKIICFTSKDLLSFCFFLQLTTSYILFVWNLSHLYIFTYKLCINLLIYLWFVSVLQYDSNSRKYCFIDHLIAHLCYVYYMLYDFGSNSLYLLIGMRF